MYVAISAAGAFRTDDGAETLDADQQGRRRRLPPREVPRGRPVRPQAARAPGEDRAALAAEPLRRLPLRRPRRELGAAGRQRPAQRLRLPDHDPPARAGHGLGDPRERRPQPRDGRRPPRRLPNAGRRRVVGADARTGCPSTPGRACCARRRRSTRPIRSGLYFGTQGGSVWASPNEGDEWVEAAANLPPILSVEAHWEE